MDSNKTAADERNYMAAEWDAATEAAVIETAAAWAAATVIAEKAVRAEWAVAATKALTAQESVTYTAEPAQNK